MAFAPDATPPDLMFPCLVMDTVFHPTQDVLAVALVSGNVQLFTYSAAECKRRMTVAHHDAACRALQFNADGTHLYTASADHTIKAVDEHGVQVWNGAGAHTDGVNALLHLGGATLASGDESGCVKVWDTRAHVAGATFREHTDFISDFAFDEARFTLLAAGGDGRLSAMDLRTGKLLGISDQLEDELLSVEIIKGGKKVVAGSQGGILNMYTWGEWADLNDRFPGHPQSIDTMLKVDEDTVATGSSDGLIRLIQLQPNKLLGVLGEHEEFPVERIQFSRDRRLMSSCSHDNTVKFWDVAYLYEEDDEEEEAGAGADPEPATAAAGAPGPVAASFKKRGTAMPVAAEEDFDDDDDDSDIDDDGDDDDSSDSEAEAAGAGAGSSAVPRKPPTSAQRFFSDL